MDHRTLKIVNNNTKNHRLLQNVDNHANTATQQQSNVIQHSTSETNSELFYNLSENASYLNINNHSKPEETQIKNSFENLLFFLDKYKSSNDNYTLLLVEQEFGMIICKWNIPTEDTCTFYDFYSDVITSSSQKLCFFKEKRCATASPIVINLCLEYFVNEDDIKKGIESKWTAKVLKNVIDNITNILLNNLDDKSKFTCIVRKLEKPLFIKNENDNIVIDEILINFPYIITTYDFQCRLRKEYMKILNHDIKGIIYHNTFDEIYTECCHELYMFGSSEYTKQPNKIYKIYNDKHLSIDNLSPQDLVKLFSIRRTEPQAIVDTNIKSLNDIYKITSYCCREISDSLVCQHKILCCMCIECQVQYKCSHLIYKEDCLECSPHLFCEYNSKIFQSYKLQPICKDCNLLSHHHYLGYCFKCFTKLVSAENLINLRARKKEISIVTHIKSFFTEFNWIHNRKITGGKYNKRADLRTEFKQDCCMVIEVDEHRHDDNNLNKEKERLTKIFKDYQKRAMVVIRFNPDDYINSSGEITHTVWSRILATGELVITKEDEYKRRITVLNNVVKYWFETNPNDGITITELFY